MSLNFAMFRAALARGEKIGAGPVLRVWRGLLVFLSRWFQIESLYKFNAKFRPRWEPRFVVYRASADLPRIGFAAMQAEGFVTLTLPRFLRRGHRRGDRARTGCRSGGESGVAVGSPPRHLLRARRGCGPGVGVRGPALPGCLPTLGFARAGGAPTAHPCRPSGTTARSCGGVARQGGGHRAPCAPRAGG